VVSILLFYSTSEIRSQSIQSPPTDTCGRWHNWCGVKPQTQEEFRMQRDTLMHYIESCAANEDSYEIFSALTTAIHRYNEQDTNRYNSYRDWLLSVLYLNTTSPYYYCACVEAMITTYQYGPYNYTNAPLAVMKFLLENGNCSSPGLQDTYNQTLRSRHESWLSGDTTKPEDTTIPPLDSIGLGILLHHSGVSPSTTPSEVYLASSPNPFKNETHLRFHLNRMTYTTIGIYDVLGHQVWGEGKGRSLEAGDHEIVVDGSSLPDGSFYARIETGFGEVKTVKLIHQE